MERRFQKLNLFDLIIWLFISNYVGLIVLSYIFAPFTVLYVQNMLGIVYFLILLVFRHKHFVSHEKAIVITVVVMWIQQILSFLSVGIGAGFQLSCFTAICCCFFLVYYSSNHRREFFIPVIIEIVSVVLYLSMMVASRFMHPWYIIDERVAQYFFTYNSVCAMLQILVFTDVFRMRIDISVGQLQRQADVDDLTGLLNRHGIRTILDIVSQQWKNNAVPYAVAIFDIDDFKQVNDTYGHAAGDAVLKFVAEKLELFKTGKSAPCRWGGEEFMVVGQITFDLALFYEYLNRIREQVEEHEFTAAGESFHVTITCGGAVIENDMPIHELIDKADHRLYAGKNSGKNQVVVYD